MAAVAGPTTRSIALPCRAERGFNGCRRRDLPILPGALTAHIDNGGTAHLTQDCYPWRAGAIASPLRAAARFLRDLR